MRGRIVKGVGGFYEVQTDEDLLTCRARGRFRREGLRPMIGDLVEICPQPEGHALIDRLLPRRNALLRPPAANIDQLVIVAAASRPLPDWLLVDKLLLQCSLLGIRPILALNKLDEGLDGVVRRFREDYAGAFPCLLLSTRTGEGLDELRSMLAGQVSCLAGQSAVGKSSLLNALIPSLSLEVGGLSVKTERGRHTTRHAQLWPFLGGAVLDTPGFSLLDLAEIEQDQLDAAYPEFGEAPARCRFSGCAHISEPACAVKTLLHEGRLSAGRYERYKDIHAEIESRRKARYD
ncbi:MAG: ribosome small subunit-dependent GTPase A [Clostridia bacterium]|nr:ribosome small subunit-dependent GTPase A [Clostridia bacterium]